MTQVEFFSNITKRKPSQEELDAIKTQLGAASVSLLRTKVKYVAPDGDDMNSYVCVAFDESSSDITTETLCGIKGAFRRLIRGSGISSVSVNLPLSIKADLTSIADDNQVAIMVHPQEKSLDTLDNLSSQKLAITLYDATVLKSGVGSLLGVDKLERFIIVGSTLDADKIDWVRIIQGRLGKETNRAEIIKELMKAGLRSYL